MVAARVGAVAVIDDGKLVGSAPRAEALDLMLGHHFRHLPIVSSSGRAVGMLSIRSLLSHQVRRLGDSVMSLEQCLAADGPGG